LIDCPFCNFDKLKGRMIQNKKHVYVILSDPRRIPGHTLVIPKQHVLKPSELSKEVREVLFDTIIEFQEKILKFSSGCDITQHYRPFLLQSNIKVDHAHFHLLPREFEDELYTKAQVFEKALFKDLPEVEADKFYKLLQ